MDRALVTGASSGIGAAIVKALRREGLSVTAVARRRSRLVALAEQTGCDFESADVTDSPTMTRIVDELLPDVVVNNAGVGMGFFGVEGISMSDAELALKTNVIAPVKIAKAAIPHMRQRKSGHIVNMGSIAGLHTLVSSVYGAGKSALHRFSQNLRYELLGSGVRVTEICPGRVETEFYDYRTGNIEEHSQAPTSIQALQPRDVADAVMFALKAPPHVNVSTIELLPLGQAVGGARFAE